MQLPLAEVNPDVPKRGTGPASSVVSNHMGFLEGFGFVCSPLYPSFTPNAGVKKIPLGNSVPASLQCIYVNRAGT